MPEPVPEPVPERPPSPAPSPAPEPASLPPPPSEDVAGAPRARPARHAVLLRLDPTIHAALARWADDELRSVNAQIELLIRRALDEAGRMPHGAGPLPRRGRPSAVP